MRQVPGLAATTASSVDGRQPFPFRATAVSAFAKIDRLDLASGKRQPAQEIVLADPAGFNPAVSQLALAPNGSYCYSYLQGLTELYAVDGIQ